MNEPAAQGDTRVQSAERLVAVELKVDQVSKDVGEIKSDIRDMVSKIGAFSVSEAKSTALLEMVNTNAARSETRWNQMLASRDHDLAEWTEWRKRIEASRNFFRGSFWLAGLVVTAAMGLLTSFGIYYVQQGADDRAMLTKRVRANEIELMSKDPAYRPAQ